MINNGLVRIIDKSKNLDIGHSVFIIECSEYPVSHLPQLADTAWQAWNIH